MKVAAHILAYNVNRYIEPVLKNMEPHVDKIYVAYSPIPWEYNTAKEKMNLRNPTSLEYLHSKILSDKVEIIQGTWATEESMRNACLNRATEDGFDWLIIQDADEFYTAESWSKIRRFLFDNIKQNHITTTWYNFWKSSQYVLVERNGDVKGTNAGFAVRCGKGNRFIRKRITNYESTRTLDCPCFHYGYALTDEEMAEKIRTWGHVSEIKTRWFEYKWLNWNENTRNLHPVHPLIWNRAIRFPFLQPDFSHEFLYEVTQMKTNDFCTLLGNSLYDKRAIVNDYFKNIISSVSKVF